jgi:hypothetical protein
MKLKDIGEDVDETPLDEDTGQYWLHIIKST